jgi:hypothetical protein
MNEKNVEKEKQIKNSKLMAIIDLVCMVCWIICLVLELTADKISVALVAIYSVCIVTFIISAALNFRKYKRLKAEA